VLSRVFELREKIKIFLHDTDEVNKSLFHGFKRLAQVEHFSDSFSILSSLNLSLQGRDVTIIRVQDKIKAFLQKCELWSKWLGRGKYDSFIFCT
jgi:hypothetical protein